MSREIVPTFAIDEDGLGPAMAALSPAKRAYVVARVYMGLAQAKAAEAAGYSASSPNVSKTNGYRLEHDEDVQAAVAEECRKLMRTEGAASIRALVRERDNPRAKPAERIKAAQALLDRCGLGGISESHVTIDHNVHRSIDDIDRSTIEYARQLGFDEATTRKLLAKPDRIIEGVFTEVPRERPRALSAEERAEEAAAQEHRDHNNELRREMAVLTPEERAERKRLYREQMRKQAKARYAEARNGIADAIAKGAEFDVVAAVADVEAKYAVVVDAINECDDLADLLAPKGDDHAQD